DEHRRRDPKRDRIRERVELHAEARGGVEDARQPPVGEVAQRGDEDEHAGALVVAFGGGDDAEKAERDVGQRHRVRDQVFRAHEISCYQKSKALPVKIALVYPPTCDPTAPYLAVPMLTGFLRAHGVEVLPIDANLEAWDALLRPAP